MKSTPRQGSEKQNILHLCNFETLTGTTEPKQVRFVCFLSFKLQTLPKLSPQCIQIASGWTCAFSTTPPAALFTPELLPTFSGITQLFFMQLCTLGQPGVI